MPYAVGKDGVRLFYEETGSGTPIVFLHEYGGDYRGWEPQLSHFGRQYRCIAYNARGYPPSDVPGATEDYSPSIAVADAISVLDHLDIQRAYIIGLAMGSFTTLFLGLAHPTRALGLVVAGCGYGADPSDALEHKRKSDEVASLYEEKGSVAAAEMLASGPARIQYMIKDPLGWAAFAERMRGHSATGAAQTQRRVLRERAHLYELQADLQRLQLPTLLIVGDEDDPCLEANLFLKRTIQSSALAMFPRSGHTLNLEEPYLFNQFVGDFLGLVGSSAWKPRDPRSHSPAFTARFGEAR